MPFLQNTLDLIKGVFQRSKSPQVCQHNETNIAHVPQLGSKDLASGYLSRKSSDKCERWLERIDRPNKRKPYDLTELDTRKRRKTDQDDESDLSDPFVDNRSDGAYEEASILTTNQKKDRKLMPPPKAPVTCEDRPRRNKKVRRESLEVFDASSEAQTQRTRLSEIDDQYDMEAARRKAAATVLPLNSGTWEPAEQDLFYHLSYRGFEPLIPKNWMRDFGTLPLSLFATKEDQTPLIKFHRSTEFRAVKALRELIDTGKAVRDRVLVPNGGLRREPVIEKAVNKYIKWALKDIGISSKQCIPVHAVIAMKQGHSTRDTIRELTVKTHKLSARHREACDVLTSIEQKEEANIHYDQEETRITDDFIDPDHKLPVIYGVMICSSLLAVFTLSSHTPPPRFVVGAEAKNAVPGSTLEEEREEENINDNNNDNEDSGLRFIASFDFSDSASDVWNAFVIAIVAMMIRNTLSDVYDISAVRAEQDHDESVLDSSLIDDELEEGGKRYIARYAASKNFKVFNQWTEPVLADADDPDL